VRTLRAKRPGCEGPSSRARRWEPVSRDGTPLAEGDVVRVFARGRCAGRMLVKHLRARTPPCGGSKIYKAASVGCDAAGLVLEAKVAPVRTVWIVNSLQCERVSADKA
jgi:hypothetical protein